MSRVVRRLRLLLGLGALVALAGAAHVGSPDAIYQGRAGAYDVRVLVTPAGVVPGQATIVVHAGGAARVLATAAPWRLGAKGAPRPDPLARDPKDASLFTGKLWLMTSGSYGVHVTVEGPQGSGAVVVPVMSSATRTLPMGQATGGVLAVLGVVLVAGMLAIVRAATGEATVAPGEQPKPAERRRSRLGMAVAAVVMALALLGGRAWWNGVEAAHRRGLFKPLAIDARADYRSGARLRVVITDSAWTRRPRQMTAMVPDHGRLMHLFLVSEDGMRAFAHLHPVTRDTTAFEAALPFFLPGGRYRLYADVVHASGFAQTLVSRVTLGDDRVGAGAAGPALDVSDVSDDAAYVGEASSRDTVTYRSPGGTVRAVLVRPERCVAGRESSIEVRILDADGEVAMVAPYLGMAAHAAITRADGSVFAHLHPMGTVSDAALRKLAARERGDTSALAGIDTSMAAMHEATALPGEIVFPYVFPRAGWYRMWVQFRIDGRVTNAAWDLDVAAAP